MDTDWILYLKYYKIKWDYFGVNTIQEAQTIRQLGINTPILITGPIDIGDINLVLKTMSIFVLIQLNIYNL